MENVALTDIKSLIVDYFINNAGVTVEALSDGNVQIENLGIDSLTMIEMLWEVEEKFGVHIDDFAGLKDMTIDMVAQYIQRLVPATA